MNHAWPRLNLLASFLLLAATIGSSAVSAEIVGHQPDVKVKAPTRIDWVFAVSNQSPAAPPANWLADYDSTAQSYERYVPQSLKPNESPGLILFISPSDRATGLAAFRSICDSQRLIFASPHAAGNNVDTRQRIRTVLDVLDQLRRDFPIDPDRTYIGGFSGGGRIACAIGFSLPEYFGGVIPVCAAGDLREEPWLRQRARERLSVAHLTGESDFNRGEVERFRGPMLAEVGVRSKVWVAPRTGHAIPTTPDVKEALEWLEQALPQRRQLADQFPASRLGSQDAPTREQSAQRLLAEGELRLKKPATRYSGLMQVKGVLERWPDLKTAQKAQSILLEFERGDDRTWEEEDIAEQRRFLIARAKCLTAYATGPLPPQYQRQRPDMARAAVELWKLVISDGQDEAAVAEGRRRLKDLEEVLADADK